jgi:hypothetical protein
MKEPTTIPDGVAHNMATSAASLLDDATACIEDPTPQNVADLLASMRIMQHRLAKALQEVEEPVSHTITFAKPINPRLQEVEEPVSHTITFVKPINPRRGTLQLFFDDASGPVIDLSPLLKQGGVFEPLRDPKRFAAVEVGPGGRSLVWRVVVALSADAVWQMVHPDAG